MRITVPEAASRIGVGAETIRRWIRSGRLPAAKVGTQHVIDERDLDAVAPRRLAERAPAYDTVPAGDRDEARTRLLQRIALSSTVLRGKPVIRGTRLSVETILDLLAGGWTEAQIIENYPNVSPEDIRACIAYAAERLAAERVYPIRG